MAFVLTFLLRRLAHGIVVVLLVSFLIFALLRVIPGDPVRMMLGLNVSQAMLEQKAKELGLRDPVPVQYANFLYNLARGDLGRSYLLGESGGAAPSAQNKLGGQITAEEELARETRTTRASVLKLIGDGLPYTLQLAALGLLFTMIVALPLGIAGGLKPERWQDRAAFFVGSLLVSIPNFWLALVLILLISSKANLLPAIGYKGFAYTILPAIVLAVELAPVIIRGLSVSISSSLQAGFVDGGIVRGLPWSSIVWRHVVRNASIPMLNLFGIQIGGLLLGGVFVAEYIFDYPGVGKLTIQAVLQRDFPIIQGVAILAAAVLVVVNILVDLAATYIDRRLKY
jgi:ABC-type dipeptide/oligopeptide/nickel transport system permease component